MIFDGNTRIAPKICVQSQKCTCNLEIFEYILINLVQEPLFSAVTILSCAHALILALVNAISFKFHHYFLEALIGYVTSSIL